MAVDTRLLATLNAADEKYSGEEMVKVYGPTLLTWGMDSSRANMFTSNAKQTLTLLDPDVPRLQGGFENTIGRYNKAYKQLEGKWEVTQIIPKFSSLDSADPNSPQHQIITVVLYNAEKNLYEMIEKPIAENLTEKFGYVYNSKFMDNLSVGDKVEDPILYKSTSYDDNMNYRYGKNARIYYTTSTDTIEDAISIRGGWADSVKTAEVDDVQVMLNNNDVLLNLYGDESNYQPFPYIGQTVNNSMICATRQINKQRLLFDFQKSYMREVMDTDVDYYVGKNSVVYDINVYYNGDEPFPDSIFYNQLQMYYIDNCNYADAIYKAATEIKLSNANYTSNVSFMRSKYKNYNDPTYKWKNKDRAFNHIIIEFKVKSVVDMEEGSKATGRYGNKGVVARITNGADDQLMDDVASSLSQDRSDEEKITIRNNTSIVADERMPYYIVDGERVYADILLNCSGSVRRLNPAQLMETEVNFIAERVVDKIKKTRIMKTKLSIIYRLLDLINIEQSLFFKQMIDDDVDKQRAFIKDVEENGFYLVRPPHKPLLLDDVIGLYREFPDITPVDIYVDLFGITERKVIRRGIIGYQYMIILKQNSNKNFSARSTFRVNRSNLPVKDIAKKTNRSSYARTPVKLSEIYNLLASISAKDLAEWNICMRSSALGRKSLDTILSSTGNPLAIKKLKIRNNYTNANVDILASKLKSMGLRIVFSSLPEGQIKVYNDEISALNFGDYIIYDHPSNRLMYSELFDAFGKEFKSVMVVEAVKGDKHDYCWDIVFSSPDITSKYDISDEMKDTLKATTKGHASRISNDLVVIPKVKDVVVDPDSPPPKKRGRKSKAEKVRLEEEARRAMEAINDIIEDEPEPEVIEVESTLENEEDIFDN